MKANKITVFIIISSHSVISAPGVFEKHSLKDNIQTDTVVYFILFFF